MQRAHVLLAVAFAAGCLTGALATAGYSLREADPAPAKTESAGEPAPASLPGPAAFGASTAEGGADTAPFVDPAPDPAGKEAATTGDRALAARLEAMTAGWTRMEQEIGRLNGRIDVLERRLAAAAATPMAEPAVPPDTPEQRRSALVKAGVAEDLAAELLWRESQGELERLEVRDLALREGWFGSDRYREEMARLEAQAPDLRSELGDEVYDRYLFNAGEENRVRVATVIPGSAAEEAGLAAGDLIEVYGDTRVFSFGELRRATAAGERGELVPVQVVRQDGARLQAWLPRGPLGVRLDLTRMDPDA